VESESNPLASCFEMTPILFGCGGAVRLYIRQHTLAFTKNAFGEEGRDGLFFGGHAHNIAEEARLAITGN
jgi:hypothetical protein